MDNCQSKIFIKIMYNYQNVLKQATVGEANKSKIKKIVEF